MSSAPRHGVDSSGVNVEPVGSPGATGAFGALMPWFLDRFPPPASLSGAGEVAGLVQVKWQSSSPAPRSRRAVGG
jgi:hypothetical protein